MPPWLKTALGFVEPITEVLPAAEAFGKAIAGHLTSGGSIAERAIEIAKDVGDFVSEIENAIHANTGVEKAAVA